MGLVAKRRDEAGSAQQLEGANLGHVDDDDVDRIAVADEAHDAPLARRGVLHPALVAADREAGHAVIISGACDGNPGHLAALPGHRACGPADHRQELRNRDDVGAPPEHFMAHPPVIGGDHHRL
jgi:hypothetical protein